MTKQGLEYLNAQLGKQADTLHARQMGWRSEIMADRDLTDGTGLRPDVSAGVARVISEYGGDDLKAALNDTYLATGTADPTVKADIKTASASALVPLTALETSIEANDDITTTSVSTAESALAGLQSALAKAQAPAATSTGN